ncbi:hypothetical protein Bbelb_169850 [Branchiostoma belcheri]|nr:hypothetical protein Bbelb_169850 [Branchiostoma belcheri]
MSGEGQQPGFELPTSWSRGRAANHWTRAILTGSHCDAPQVSMYVWDRVVDTVPCIRFVGYNGAFGWRCGEREPATLHQSRTCSCVMRGRETYEGGNSRASRAVRANAETYPAARVRSQQPNYDRRQVLKTTVRTWATFHRIRLPTRSHIFLSEGGMPDERRTVARVRRTTLATRALTCHANRKVPPDSCDYPRG